MAALDEFTPVSSVGLGSNLANNSGIGTYGPTPNTTNNLTDGTSPGSLLDGELSADLQQTGTLYNGKTTFTNTVTGFIIGIDFSVATPTVKFYIGSTTNYLNWDGSSLTIAGSLTAASINIPDTTTANSFHVDSSGNAWWGATALGSAVAKVLATGAATFTNMTITAGTISGVTISIGSANAIFKADTNGIYLGNATFASAPFRVDMNGNLTATSATLTGTITSTAGTIGGFTINATTLVGTNLTLDSGNQKITLGSANNILIMDAADATYRLAIGNATYGSAPFRVDKAGNVTAAAITITGGSITTTPISGIPNNSSTDISLLEFSQNLAFTSASATQVNWSSGTINMSNGRTFSISSGNTGTMAALTYIYLDTGASSTVLQTTTTYSTAIGANKILVAVAQNNTTAASVLTYGGGQPVIDGSSQIGALSILAGSIAAGAITASKISVTTLSAVQANTGALTVSGALTVGTSGSIGSGQSSYNTGTGYWLEYNAGTPRFSIGSSTNYLTWDGTSLSVQGTILLGTSNITLAPGVNVLQTAINTLNSAGGGTLYLQAGTYTCTSAITLYSNVNIIGAGQNNTTITFGSTSTNMTMTGLNVYTTGTISSISGGVNVVGSGTTWTSGMVGQQIFINNRWYVISARTDNTHITLATGYADGATFSGTYRISSPIHDVTIANVTLTASTGTAVAGTDVRNINFNSVIFASNNKGFTLTNAMSISANTTTIASSTSNGYEITNGSFIDFLQVATVSNGGHGAVLNTIKSSTFYFSAADSNTTDGYNCTSVTNTVLETEAASNGSIGIQFVSGCNNNFIQTCLVNNNISDGIKLTASSSNNTLGSGLNITGNGGWGINIADSGDSNNTIVVPYYATNSSGTLQDLGTSTNNVQTVPPSAKKFGGTGSDGALTITSGTTTIDCANAAVVVKNYTSISITGTGKLAFSNPNANGTVIILKSQGGVTLTSSTAPMIDASGMGAPGGASITSAGVSANGIIGSSGFGFFYKTNAGTGGTTAPAGGTGGAATSTLVFPVTTNLISIKYPQVFVGAGGGSGGHIYSSSTESTVSTGVGGKGGGGLVIECAGSFNFTTASGISVAGTAGGNGTTDGVNAGVGGGGGGGGGYCLIMYNTLTASSGTITVSGGTGGNGNEANSNPEPGGAGGGSYSNAGSNGTTSTVNGTKTGGDGAAGLSLVTLNTEYA